VIDSANCATALVFDPPHDYRPETDRVKFAFDADAVVFSEESELIYKTQDLEAFHLHEKENEDLPLSDGPFAKLLRKLSKIQDQLPMTIEQSPFTDRYCDGPERPQSYACHQNPSALGGVCG
jgi:5'-nucleotidase